MRGNRLERSRTEPNRSFPAPCQSSLHCRAWMRRHPSELSGCCKRWLELPYLREAAGQRKEQLLKRALQQFSAVLKLGPLFHSELHAYGRAAPKPYSSKVELSPELQDPRGAPNVRDSSKCTIARRSIAINRASHHKVESVECLQPQLQVHRFPKREILEQ